jgi:hypothetical protein
MVFRSMARVVAAVAVPLVLVVVPGAAPSRADTVTDPTTGMTVTVDGGPIYLKGDGTEVCSGTTAGGDQSAHLSGTLTVTVTNLPVGTDDLYIQFGGKLLSEGFGGFFDDESPPPPTPYVVTVPATGFNLGYSCDDGAGGVLPYVVQANDNNDGQLLAAIEGDVQLSNVD